jgi:hypothetical protein
VIFTALNAGSLSGGGGDRRGAILAVPLEIGTESERSVVAGGGDGSDDVDVDGAIGSEEPPASVSEELDPEQPLAASNAPKAAQTTARKLSASRRRRARGARRSP